MPLAGFGVLAMLSFTLIGVVVLRPWAGPDKSWKLHLNLTEEPLLSNYTRSVQSFVSEEGSASIEVWQLEPCDGGKGEPSAGGPRDVDSSGCDNQGRVEFVVHGCSGCHGLDAKGGAVGPPLAGKAGNIVEFFARNGPGGMPVFREEELTPEHLGKIIEYLGSLEPIVRPTPTPTPTPRSPQPTPTPTLQTTPAAGTPAPTLSPEEMEAARQLFTNNGCSACHGAQAGGGIGPSLLGADPDTVRNVVRTGRGAMPAFNEGRLSDQELGQIIAYLQSLQ